MVRKSFLAPVDAVLKEHGFVRRKMTWNRRSGRFVDVVDLQVSKAGDQVTLNAGVVEPDTHRLLWGEEPHLFIQEPACTVRVRVGQLIDGRDHWWPLDDDARAAEVARTLDAHLLPFLERMHDPLEMERQLAPELARSYPPPIIYSAILKHRRGETAEATALLRELRERTSEPWRAKVSVVCDRLGLRA